MWITAIVVAVGVVAEYVASQQVVLVFELESSKQTLAYSGESWVEPEVGGLRLCLVESVGVIEVELALAVGPVAVGVVVAVAVAVARSQKQL